MVIIFFIFFLTKIYFFLVTQLMSMHADATPVVVETVETPVAN